MKLRVAKACGASAVAAVLGGCRIDAPPSPETFASGSDGSSGSLASSSGSSLDGTGGDVSTETSHGVGASSGDGPSLTSSLEATSGTTDELATSGDASTTGSAAFCGDRNLDPGEICDDGINDGSYGGCLSDCSAPGPFCGDGAVNGPEVCDDEMNDGSYGGCTAACLFASYCGDGLLDPVEEACDDGINDGAYGGCMPGCSTLAAYCGDDLVNGSEVCDYGVNDGSYGGCAGDCLAFAGFCGNGVVDGPELCDDGAANGSYGSCAVGCAGIAEHCGDGWINGPEVCDDGVNDGAYGNCGLDCLIPPEYCGDGITSGPEACDDGNLDSADGCFTSCEVPTSCVDIKAFDPALPDGAYVIDADGVGGAGAFEVYCNMTIDGGGWQLVSVRYQDIGVLFADDMCTSIDADCSGTIPGEQLVPGDAPDLLFATTDGVYWLRLTGLNPPGSYSLLDVITLDRVLADTASCTGNHYCNVNIDAGLMVAGSSPNFVPRSVTLPSQFVREGGIWLGNGGGSANHHVVSLNYFNYCSPSGLQLSDASSLALGDVTCTQPGALYFRY